LFIGTTGEQQNIDKVQAVKISDGNRQNIKVKVPENVVAVKSLSIVADKSITPGLIMYCNLKFCKYETIIWAK
jgi:hypothetical protein